MTDRWRKYFNKQGAFGLDWLTAAVAHWGFHEVLYGTVQGQCAPPASILDVGCGPGWSDLYLSSAGYDVTGIDCDASLVEHARKLAKRFGMPTNYELADAFDLAPYHGRFDLVYSCGVLEHFDRQMTIDLLKEQAKCAPLVLIQIPTRFTAYTGKITDERIYTPKELRHMVVEADLSVKACFGYGDVTATRSQVWLRRLLPRAVYRYLHNLGFAYSIAVLGERKSRFISPS